MTREKREQYERDIESAKRIAANPAVSFAMRQAVALDGILKICALRGYGDYTIGARDD